MDNSKIVLKIRNGEFSAEGVNFKGQECKDKMNFLAKLGTLIFKKNKADPTPDPTPRIHLS